MSAAKQQELANRLTPFLPGGTAQQVASLIARHKVRFRISKPRRSKLGDYRPPGPNGGHRISVNGDLNPFGFYITTLHEFGHLIAFEKYGMRIAPHGKEWKQVFGSLLHDALQQNVFPEEIHRELERYLQSPAASSCADHGLFRAVRLYDDQPVVLLEDLPENSRFAINGNRIFQKGPKLRKRFRCLDEHNERMYLISAVAEVQPLS